MKRGEVKVTTNNGLEDEPNMVDADMKTTEQKTKERRSASSEIRKEDKHLSTDDKKRKANYENQLVTDVSRAEYENRIVTDVSRASYENRIVTSVSRADRENRIVTSSVSRGDHERDTYVSRASYENRIVTSVSRADHERDTDVPSASSGYLVCNRTSSRDDNYRSELRNSAVLRVTAEVHHSEEADADDDDDDDINNHVNGENEANDACQSSDSGLYFLSVLRASYVPLSTGSRIKPAEYTKINKGKRKPPKHNF